MLKKYNVSVSLTFLSFVISAYCDYEEKIIFTGEKVDLNGPSKITLESNDMYFLSTDGNNYVPKKGKHFFIEDSV